MAEITHDPDVCQRCGPCVMTCTVAILEQVEKHSVPRADKARLDECVCCEQCVAVCSQGGL